MTRDQQNTLNAACEDLAEQIAWHGQRLSKDDWRHLISGMVLGWRAVPAINVEGIAGFEESERAQVVMLGGSSLKLSVRQASLAIELAFWVGDEPDAQGLKCDPVRWGPAVCKARWLLKDDGHANY